VTKRAAPRSLDDQLRAILNAWSYWGSVKKIVALGRPGFERVLDVKEGTLGPSRLSRLLRSAPRGPPTR
jgi:hypothetical protein